MRTVSIGLASAFALIATTALAFGTINGMGQNQEHERITRHALGCGQGLGNDVCFQSKSLDEIAGKPGTWGGVGAPDNPARGLAFSSDAHCDNADWVNVPNYPQSQANARNHLISCRNAMKRHMDEAVKDAAKLLKSNGKIDDSEIPTWVTCTYLGTKGRAKCNVIEDFGRVLHASQDFYSHSNWVDRPASGGITLSNPAGLGNSGRAPWLNLRQDVGFPDGLITGCFDTLSAASPSKGCPGHVKHEDLNKDKGTIDPSLGAGTTERGKINANFQRAVDAAIDDTRDKWATLRERLVSTYGAQKGNKMICALTHDNPAKTC
ncbi:MAG: CinY protein [Proteobacteria bacterium]|nr:CinY protein [Pseudomonadota bacterium]